MKRNMLVLTAVLTMMAASVASAETTYNVTVHPNDNSDGSPGVGVIDPSAPLGSGAIAALSNPSIYEFTPSSVSSSLAGLTIGEITSISYYTKTGQAVTLGGSNDADWFFQIYTAPTAASGNGWYGYRIQAEPYQSVGLNAPANTWTQFTSDTTGTNQLGFYLSKAYNTTANYGDPATNHTLSGLQSETVGADGTLGDQAIQALGLGTGSAYAGFNGEVDDLVIGLTGNRQVVVDFEPSAVPLPASAWSGLALLGGLGLFGAVKRRRQHMV